MKVKCTFPRVHRLVCVWAHLLMYPCVTMKLQVLCIFLAEFFANMMQIYCSLTPTYSTNLLGRRTFSYIITMPVSHPILFVFKYRVFLFFHFIVNLIVFLDMEHGTWLHGSKIKTVCIKRYSKRSIDPIPLSSPFPSPHPHWLVLIPVGSHFHSFLAYPSSVSFCRGKCACVYFLSLSYLHKG